MNLYVRGRGIRGPGADCGAVRFGVGELKKALAGRGEHAFEQSRSMLIPDPGEKALALSIVPDAERSPEGFSIRRDGELVTLTGFGEIGLMYGLLDIAETVRLYGWGAVAPSAQEPFHKKRGVKFNLPFQPYADGEIFEKNIETVKDFAFWNAYIETLAKNRYNCLSLWSENPFEYMLDVAKYPDASDLSKEQRRENRELFTRVFARARELGLEVYLITWNLRISKGIARGLGLPEELARYPHHSRSIGLRQNSEVIRDYFREAVKAMMLTYPDLTGIGTSNSEELTGTPEEREQWVVDTYLGGLQDLGYPVPFIHRTNMSSGVIAQDMFLARYHGKEKYISWKYSNAHMYSHPHPQFESIFNAWGDMDLSGFRVLYTVRNDDFHNLRGCDPDFIREYIKGMRKPYVDGFYWGADGYVWAGEHQHVPNHPHVEWQYAFEKHWLQHEIIGRLAYNPELPSALWEDRFTELYGEAGLPLYKGLTAGVRMLCAVNRLYWLNYDFQWHPESLLGREGFKTILDFMAGVPMPGVGVMGMRELAEKGVADGETRETPPEILGVIEAQLAALDDCIRAVGGLSEPVGELECVFWDVKAWRALGGYYLKKLKAAIELLIYERTGDGSRKTSAVALLREALEFWKELACIGSQHYMPYRMARVEQTFGWSYYIREAERDVERAAAVRPISAENGGVNVYKPGEWSGF